MKIVKGDIVYLRSGKDVAGMSRSRLQEALGVDGGAAFQERIANMPMAEQISAADRIKGIRGKVIRVMPTEKKLVVEGLNMVTRHLKPGSQSGAGQVQQGGRIKMEAAVPISRVMLVCPHCDHPTRVGMQSRQEHRQTLRGEKIVMVRERVCKQCGEIIQRPTDTRFSQ